MEIIMFDEYYTNTIRENEISFLPTFDFSKELNDINDKTFLDLLFENHLNDKTKTKSNTSNKESYDATCSKFKLM